MSKAGLSGDVKPDVSTTGRHVPALDGIRGLAILLVFACHFLWSNSYSGHNPIVWLGIALKNVGWVGVDLFFVLSGFLITGILYDTLQSPKFFRNFYARRSLRIFPLYYGFLALVTVVIWTNGGRWNHELLLRLLTYTQNLVLRGPDVVPAVSVPWIALQHFWSLAIEEQFYLVWPLLVFLLRTKGRIAMGAAVGVLLSFTVRILISKTNLPAENPYILYSWTPAHLDGLFLGALLAMGIRSEWQSRLLAISRPVLWIGLALLGVMAWRYSGLDFTRDRAVSVWGIPVLAVTFAALVAASLRPGSWPGRVFSRRFMRFFGKYSYGMYVYHYTFVAICMYLRLSIGDRLHSKTLGVFLPACIGVGLTIVTAMLSFHFFESRFLTLKRYFEDHTSTPKLKRILAE